MAFAVFISIIVFAFSQSLQTNVDFDAEYELVTDAACSTNAVRSDKGDMIGGRSECERAARLLGKAVHSSSIRSTTRPSGCVWSSLRNKFYYNTYMTSPNGPNPADNAYPVICFKPDPLAEPAIPEEKAVASNGGLQTNFDFDAEYELVTDAACSTNAVPSDKGDMLGGRSECGRAAELLGKAVHSSSIRSTTRPSGCVWSSLRNKFYYNTYMTSPNGPNPANNAYPVICFKPEVGSTKMSFSALGANDFVVYSLALVGLGSTLYFLFSTIGNQMKTYRTIEDASEI